MNEVFFPPEEKALSRSAPHQLMHIREQSCIPELHGNKNKIKGPNEGSDLRIQLSSIKPNIKIISKEKEKI
jgi:hypothetical protein